MHGFEMWYELKMVCVKDIINNCVFIVFFEEKKKISSRLSMAKKTVKNFEFRCGETISCRTHTTFFKGRNGAYCTP